MCASIMNKVKQHFVSQVAESSKRDTMRGLNGIYYYKIHLGEDEVKKGKLTIID
jgi:hypothetical protein